MMKSRTSHRIARTIRQTEKVASLGLSLAKTAGDASKLGISSGAVLAHRGPMLVAAMASPASGNAPELLRMGTEKALAAFSAGTSMFPSLMSAQLAWMKFGFAQARLGGMVFQALLQGTPWTAGRVAAESTERAWANSVDAAMNLSQMGQLFWQRAARPFQTAVSANAARLAR